MRKYTIDPLREAMDDTNGTTPENEVRTCVCF